MSKRVLICDDEPDIASVISAYFENLGFTPEIEMSAMRALQRVEQEHFDLITLDYLMPEISGHDALRRMAKAKPQLKFVLITGLDAQDSRLRELQQQPQSATVLGKPFLLKDLVAALKRVGL